MSNVPTVPKARINLSLDLETGGAKQKLELPFKILVLADSFNRQENRKISEQTKIKLNQTNLKQVLSANFNRLNFKVKDTFSKEKSTLAIKLDIDDIKDFQPDNIALQVPELRKLISMRNLLKEFRSHIIDDDELSHHINLLMHDTNKLEALKAFKHQHTEAGGN